MESNIGEFYKMSISVKEKADIHGLNFKPDLVEVRGYQNFNIGRNSIQFIDQDSHSWVDTRLKTELIEKILTEKKCRSYVDFGSNLGVLVFKSAMMGVDSLGVDYNLDYVKVCSAIVHHLQIDNIKFANHTFDFFEDSKPWDLISLNNIHHHLFGRTEQPMSLKYINDTVLSKCKWFITQFPTELDPKAIKWTTHFPGCGTYSERDFIEGLGDREFHCIHDSPTRPILLIKGDIPE